jgi:hypothetical protein
MRLPRVRFTIQRMMIAVAFISFVIVGIQTARRWLYYREEYRACALFERISRENSLHPQVGLCGMMPHDEDLLRHLKAESARYNRQLTDYFLQLREKYALAMSRPWLRVAPDPPVPE